LGFLVALQFLTALPAFIHREPKPQELGRSMAFYPIVGLLVGAVLAALDWVLGRSLPSPLVAGILVVAWTVATGGLHLDGLMDVCDGLFSQATPERRLEVMKDVHCGSYGVLGCVCVLMLKFAVVLSLPTGVRLAALVLAPTVSRFAMVLATKVFPTARPTGLGALVKSSVGWFQVVVAGVVALLACYGLGGMTGAVVLAIGGGLALLLGWYFASNLGGLTGDTYGAINEVIEVAVPVVIILLPGGWRGW
jgi:adenosylcobinamide-GDP ribazoletransferase